MILIMENYRKEENKELYIQVQKPLLVCENLKETSKLREELYNDAKKDSSQSWFIVGWWIVCLVLGFLVGMHLWISFC